MEESFEQSQLEFETLFLDKTNILYEKLGHENLSHIMGYYNKIYCNLSCSDRYDLVIEFVKAHFSYLCDEKYKVDYEIVEAIFVLFCLEAEHFGMLLTHVQSLTILLWDQWRNIVIVEEGSTNTNSEDHDDDVQYLHCISHEDSRLKRKYDDLLIVSDESSMEDRLSRCRMSIPCDMSDLMTLFNNSINYGDDKFIVASKFKIDIRVRHLKCLMPRKWLNSEVIDFYFSMLQVRNDNLNLLDMGQKQYFMPWYFMSKLMGISESGSDYNFANVKRWTKKINVFKYDDLFFPVNHCFHWFLLHVSIKFNRITCFDSLYMSNGQGSFQHSCAHGLLRWLQDDWIDKQQTFTNSGTFDKNDWTIVTDCTNPQQGNDYDCGVFTAMFADLLSDGLPLTIVPQFREKIAASIIRGEVPYPLICKKKL